MYRDSNGKFIPRTDPRAVAQRIKLRKQAKAAEELATRHNEARRLGYNGALTRAEYALGYGRPVTIVRRKSVR